MGQLDEKKQSYLREKFGGRVSFHKRERKLYGHDIAVLPSLVKPVLGNTIPDAVVQPGALKIMKPMFPMLFPRLLPTMMPEVMPVMLRRVAEQIPMPDYMQEQMGELMPKVVDRLMPHMIDDVVPLVTQPMIDYLKKRKSKSIILLKH
jgi:hypothetical protein